MPYVIIDQSGQYLWSYRGGWIRIDNQILPPACFQQKGDAQDAANHVKELTGIEARAEVISASGSKRNR